MKTAGVRVGLAAAALAAAWGLFVLIVGGGGRTESATAQPKALNVGQTARARSPTSAVRIVVRNGEPVGGVARLEYRKGQRVRFTVESDRADEVHVHGFDLMSEVPANGSVRFAFPAVIEGVFEVELEASGVPIAELRISP